MGMSLADGCSQGWGLWQGLQVECTGRNAPDAKSCSGHSHASVSLANSMVTPIIRAALDDAKEHLGLDFWGPKSPLPRAKTHG